MKLPDAQVIATVAVEYGGEFEIVLRRVGLPQSERHALIWLSRQVSTYYDEEKEWTADNPDYWRGWNAAVGAFKALIRNTPKDLIAERLTEPVTTSMTVRQLTNVLYDWMPDGATVSVDFDGNSRHMTGSDLADYLFGRAMEAAE